MSEAEKRLFRKQSFEKIMQNLEDDFKKDFYNEFDIDQELNTILDDLEIKHYL